MSRRAKFLLTALLPLLLGIPVVYPVLTWHPRNPLRFRQLEETPLDNVPLVSPGDPNGRRCHTRKLMEVRNTSLATVLLMSTEISRESPEGKQTFRARWDAPPDTPEARSIPPGGTMQIEIRAGYILSAEDLKQLEAGKHLALQGSLQYAWGSRVHASTSRVCTWLRERLPESLRSRVPQLVPFVDVIHVDLTTSPSNFQASEAPNHQSQILNRNGSIDR